MPEISGGDGGEFGAEITIDGDLTTVVVTREGFPTITLTQESVEDTEASSLGLVITGIDDLKAVRAPNAEELAAGITSLDPPTVGTVEDPLALVAAGQRALAAAIASTIGLSPPSDVLLRYKLAIVVNAALRALEYDV